MEIEKEVRYKITDKSKIEDIVSNTQEIEKREQTIDLVLGWKGFESLREFGFICRIRKKRNKIYLECKKRIKENEWNESKIAINNFNEGFNFLKLLGMKPYLYINRNRQIRKYKDLIIFIDEVDMLGDFLEIEFQGVENEKEQIEEFLNTFNIDKTKQKLYGDLFKEKIETDAEFCEKFKFRLEEFLK